MCYRSSLVHTAPFHSRHPIIRAIAYRHRCDIYPKLFHSNMTLLLSCTERRRQNRSSRIPLFFLRQALHKSSLFGAEYKLCKGGKSLMWKHMGIPTLRVKRSPKKPFRPHFTCRRKDVQILSMRWWNAFGWSLQCTDQEKLRWTWWKKDREQLQRPKLKRQFAWIDEVTEFM